jgi:hypothetical protein
MFQLEFNKMPIECICTVVGDSDTDLQYRKYVLSVETCDAQSFLKFSLLNIVRILNFISKLIYQFESGMGSHDRLEHVLFFRLILLIPR